MDSPDPLTRPERAVPIDWEALEDAFENNAPEVHSYLHTGTGEVLRVVDGIADPEMHARIASDTAYLRVEPVSSREQYRWMERFIAVVEDPELRERLARSIDGKGAFRRFKDVLMSSAVQREAWFVFRSERLRVFMDAWLAAHRLAAVARPVVPLPEVPAEEPRRPRGAELLRRQLREVCEGMHVRDLEKVLAFAEFVRVRHASRAAAEGDDREAAGPPDGGGTGEPA